MTASDTPVLSEADRDRLRFDCCEQADSGICHLGDAATSVLCLLNDYDAARARIAELEDEREALIEELQQLREAQGYQ